MLIQNKRFGAIKQIVETSRLRPKVVVIGGRHEPSEPTRRLLFQQVDGMPLHTHFPGNNVVFIALHREETAEAFFERVGKRLTRFSQEMRNTHKRRTFSDAIGIKKSHLRELAKVISEFLARDKNGEKLHPTLRRSYPHLDQAYLELIASHYSPPEDADLAGVINNKWPGATIVSVHSNPRAHRNPPKIDAAGRHLPPLIPLEGKGMILEENPKYESRILLEFNYPTKKSENKQAELGLRCYPHPFRAIAPHNKVVGIPHQVGPIYVRTARTTPRHLETDAGKLKQVIEAILAEKK